MSVVARREESGGIKRSVVQPACEVATLRSNKIPVKRPCCRAPVLPGILQAITVKQQRLHASVRKNYEICGSAIDLHRVACATASKKSTFAAPRATVARRGGYHRCRENRARDAVRCRGTPGVHILSVRSYSANRCARGSRSRRATTSPNERSLETHQLYRAQAPTAMVT